MTNKEKAETFSGSVLPDLNFCPQALPFTTFSQFNNDSPKTREDLLVKVQVQIDLWKKANEGLVRISARVREGGSAGVAL